MQVFRVEKNKNYTTMSNYHLRDKKLSYKAKGLLSFMLSLPDTWDYSMNGLVSVSKENIGSIRTILHELEENRYLIRSRYQNNKGQFQYEYSIYEYPYTENPHTVTPNTEEYIQINTNIINTKNIDKIDKQFNIITKELIKMNFIELTDFDIYKYDNLFDELLKKYNYKDVIIATNYVIKRLKDNKNLDENEKKITNKFGYFKASIENNLEEINNDFDLNWD